MYPTPNTCLMFGFSRIVLRPLNIVMTDSVEMTDTVIISFLIDSQKAIIHFYPQARHNIFECLLANTCVKCHNSAE